MTTYTDKNLAYFIATHRALNLTLPRFLKLKVAFQEDWESVFKAGIKVLQQAEIDGKGIEKLLTNREKINPEKEMQSLQKCGAKILIYGQKGYPETLKNITQPPVVLFLRGELKTEDFPAIAVVGSRKITSYGKRALEKIVGEIADTGITIVSGFALGTDILAQKKAVAHGARTIGVLGNGIDTIYPSANRHFAQQILHENQGAFLSEYFPGSETRPENFPVRNRIVTGLAKATIVIEAAEKSGSLISATLANDHGREVFAVPGEIFSPQSAGTNQLILNGEAHPALSGTQILEILGFQKIKNHQDAQKNIPETGLEGEILQAFGSEQKAHINDLIKNANLPAPTVNGTLAILEIKGLIKHLGNQMYAKNF